MSMAYPLEQEAAAAAASLPVNALARLAETDTGRTRRVRLFLGDRKTGRDWGEENDVTGYVGRSSGPMRVPQVKGGPSCDPADPTHNQGGRNAARTCAPCLRVTRALTRPAPPRGAHPHDRP